MNSNQKDNDTSVNDQRVAIFIDGSNLYHSLEENCKRFDLDFAAFSKKLSKGRKIYRTYYYNVLRDAERNTQAYLDQQKFLSVLYSTPYLEVRLGESKIRGDTAVEKGIDIMLATDLLKFAWNDLYDIAILVSGDGDFSYAVKAVKDTGKHVELAAFPSNLSSDLSNIADDREFFSPTYFKGLWTRKRTKSRKSSRPGDNSRRSGYRPRSNNSDSVSQEQRTSGATTNQPHQQTLV
jgi:uncharacterized LabA/DUF88 family protein